ncbi:MAG: PepSY domain-containing protein [Alphaproteobacteria bacterium]
MKTCVIIWAVVVAIFFSVALPDVSFAAPEEQDRALELRKKEKLVSYGAIVRRAQEQFGGRVVGQKLKEQGNLMVYELKILKPNGTVIVVLYNAKTGRVISSRRK